MRVFLFVGRKPRQHYPGAFYYFIARGNDRQPIFLTSSDRRAFEGFIGDGVERFGHRNHAYCWMTNHVHMVVEVAEVPLSHVAHNLLFRYARWFHRKYGRTGHLFERRYRASLITTDAALLPVIRYIHLNPVRAAIVDRPEAYVWSSYSAYLDSGAHGPSWLTRDLVLSLFGETPVGARSALRAFTERKPGVGEEQGDRPVTPDSGEQDGPRDVRFEGVRQASVEHLAAANLTLDQVLQAVGSACSLPRSALCADTQRRAIVRARSLAGWIVNRTPHLTFEQLGFAVGRDASTLSRSVRSITRRRADPELQGLLAEIERTLGLD